MQTLPGILKKKFDTSNYKVNGPLLTGEKTEKVIELMKFEFGGKIMKQIVAQRRKMYSFLTGDDYIDKKTDCTKKCVIKRQDCKDYKE